LLRRFYCFNRFNRLQSFFFDVCDFSVH
jgi:hypothetical protein